MVGITPTPTHHTQTPKQPATPKPTEGLNQSDPEPATPTSTPKPTNQVIPFEKGK